MLDVDLLKKRIDRRRSESILRTMNDGNGGLQIYAYDGSGVRKIDDLLSDDQLSHIQQKIEEYLETIIEDTEEDA